MNRQITAAALLCAWLTGLGGAAPALATGSAEDGKGKAAACAGCHGTDGKATQAGYPNIAGQHAAYLAKQLTNYRDGDRVNQLMTGMAAALSDQDILDLAAYYESLPAIAGAAAEENLTLGEQIYRGGITSAGISSCMGCHGPAGMGNPAAAYPALNGQNAEYTADQLRYFRSGERANDPNAMMRNLAHRLSDKEIGAVANYIAGLHR